MLLRQHLNRANWSFTSNAGCAKLNGPEGGTPAPAMKKLFIVGCPRSGTTLLQQALNRHSQIVIPPETKYFFSFLGHTRRCQHRHIDRLNADLIGTAIGHNRIATRIEPMGGQSHAPGSRAIDADYPQ